MFVIRDLVNSNFPDDWKTFLICDFCNVKTSNLSFADLVKYSDLQHKTPIKVLALKVSDMNLYGNETFIKKSNFHILVNPQNPILKKLIPPNSIIFPKRGAAIATNKKRILTEYAVLDPNLIALEPDSSVDALYLFYYFKNFDLSSLQDPGTIPQLNKKDLDPIPVIVPSLTEQHKISHILSTLQKAIEKQQQIIDTTQALKKSLLYKLFTQGTKGEKLKETEIGLMPKSWEVKKLGSIVNFITGKLNSNAAVKKGKYPFFTCSQETFYIDNYAFDQEAILLSGNNASAIYSVKYYKGKFNAYQRTYIITIKNSDEYDYIFLKHALSFKLEELKRISIGTSTKYLTLGLLQNLCMPMLSLDEQILIGSAMESVNAKIQFHQSQKGVFESFFKSFLNELMTGKIRVDEIKFEVLSKLETA